MAFAQVQPDARRVYLFVASGRPSKVAFAEVLPRATKMLATDFLWRALTAIPYKSLKLLTYNGAYFGGMAHQMYAWRHMFGRVCDEQHIAPRFTKPIHPSTSGQIERFTRTLKEATVRHYHHRTTDELKSTVGLGAVVTNGRGAGGRRSNTPLAP